MTTAISVHAPNRPLRYLGAIPRLPSRSVTFWVADVQLLPAAVVLARCIQQRFPRVLVVFVQPDDADRAHGFPVFSAPLRVPLLVRWFQNRLRTQTLILAGQPPDVAANPIRAAYVRGASLVLLRGGAARSSAEASAAGDWTRLLDGVIDAEVLPAHAHLTLAPAASATTNLLDRLVTRSRKRTMAQRGSLTPGASLLRFLQQPILRKFVGFKFREYRSIDQLRQALGRPTSILCLGNGPSSEDPELLKLQFDRLFRVNLCWLQRGFLTAPDVVFTGLVDAVEKLRPTAGFVFGTIQSEETILSRSLVSAQRLRYATAERLGFIEGAQPESLAPTNGALMLAIAVALQPARLIVGGIDLYQHPAGAYPGDTETANAYAVGHDAQRELAFLIAALRRYRGELVILSEALRLAYERAPGEATTGEPDAVPVLSAAMLPLLEANSKSSVSRGVTNSTRPD
ncbi:MAG: hypothetical protein JWR16_3630 [Nevskia sp.]|nr:hypothetical protein [Nevskia sp.]